ncbi:enoyl-CoA hydratase/isomerase family protein [Methylibium sp.]|uniref:enoyl-CoA hydratase/isomerase family protein n=1 Tax=Methylibium sp. TaxID=2067992 RepID=UPI003D0D789C
MSGTLHFERDPRDPRIGLVTLSNAGKLNAISVAMWRELAELAAALEAMRPVLHVVIVRGQGGDFAAGADIAEFPAHRFSTEALRDYHERLVAPALQALLATDVPLIAQIEGGCVGGGLEIAACCDLRIAQHGARFGIPIAKLGFPMAPDELSVVLNAVGPAGAAELLLEARFLDADEALQRRLVQRVVADAGAQAAASAQRIAALPASVARANKRTLRQLRRGGPTDAERTRHFGYADSATHREGVQAFLDRRLPEFPDELG